MFIELLIEPAFGFWAARKRFEYNYLPLAMLTILVAIINPVVGLLAIRFSNQKALAKIVSNAIILCFLYSILYINIFLKGRCFYEKKYWKYALNFNLPLIPHYLSNTALNQADRLMIANMCSESDAGIYGVAYSCSMAINIVTNSLHNALIPWIYQAVKNQEYEKIRKKTIDILVFVEVTILCVIAIGPEIIKIMAPEEYYQAIWIIPPVTASVYFMFLQSLYCNIEFYFEKNLYITCASITGAILNIILNYFFIKMYGFLAGGYTTLICYILYCISHGVFVNIIERNKKIKKAIFDNKKIAAISLLFVAIVIIMTVLYEKIWLRYSVLLTLLISVFVLRKKIIHTIRGKNE